MNWISSILKSTRIIDIHSKKQLHHPIIKKYAQYVGGNTSFNTTLATPNLSVDCVGYFNFFEFLTEETSYPKRVPEYNWQTQVSPPNLPVFDEEYFEWIDLLEAIDQAEDQFVMFEFGANYGRWSGKAAAAAKIKGIPVHLGIAEAIPSRWNLIKENMKYNDVSPDNYQIVPYAVGSEDAQVFFYISKPEANQFLTNWRGQSALTELDYKPKLTTMSHEGYQVYKTKDDYQVVEVEQKRLSSILANTPFSVIDFCDFDIQGAEFESIKEAIDVLNTKVKSLHIGTHSHKIEKNLKSLLLSNQWSLERNYPCSGINKTEYGKMRFCDGVQTWKNKRFI